jgi:hypothetical protein
MSKQRLKSLIILGLVSSLFALAMLSTHSSVLAAACTDPTNTSLSYVEDGPEIKFTVTVDPNASFLNGQTLYILIDPYQEGQPYKPLPVTIPSDGPATAVYNTHDPDAPLQKGSHTAIVSTLDQYFPGLPSTQCSLDYQFQVVNGADPLPIISPGATCLKIGDNCDIDIVNIVCDYGRNVNVCCALSRNPSGSQIFTVQRVLPGTFCYNKIIAPPIKGNALTGTVLGDIPIGNPSDTVGWLTGYVISISGGIAFLLMLFGSLQVLISSGNEDNVKSGHEWITSAIAGLIFVIFSLFLLKLIGVQILGIPGLG